jgi:glycosyltransferase involved in cell wall biosynthesis
VKGADLFDAVIEQARTIVSDLQPIALEGYTRDQTMLVLNAADVVVMTSVHEGSPVAVREALACMTPVVSVDVGDVPEVLAGLPGCGIFPRDPQALARGIVEALGAPRSSALRSRAELYARPRVAERVAALYSATVGRDS